MQDEQAAMVVVETAYVLCSGESHKESSVGHPLSGKRTGQLTPMPPLSAQIRR